MSFEALDWVMVHNRSTRGVDRLVLTVLAHSADEGTGYAFLAIPTIASQAAVDRTTVMEARERLVASGQLLALPPERRGRGHHYRYVVLMGRDPNYVADEMGWPRPVLTSTVTSRAATAQLDEDLAPPSPVAHRGDQDRHRAVDRKGLAASSPDVHRDADDRHRAVRSEGSAASDPSPTEARTAATERPDPVDNPVHPPAGIGRPGPPIPAGKGRGRVGKGSAAARHSPAPSPTTTTALRARSPRPAPDVDNLPSDVAALRDAFAAQQIEVDWRMSTKQLALVQAQLAVVGVGPLVEAVRSNVLSRGAPRTAAAWLETWKCVDPPAEPRAPRGRSWCGRCDQHDRTLDGIRPGTVRKCPDCHPSFDAL